MEKHSVNSADGLPVEGLVFENGQSEGSSWKFCDSITMPRSEVLLFQQATLFFGLVITTMLRMVFDPPACQEETVCFSLLFGAVGNILPNFHL